MQPRSDNSGAPLTPAAWAIDAQGLTRRFGPVAALVDVSLQVGAGEFFSLLGPSGCGKTTLLRIIAGLEVADAGTLLLGGVNAAGIPAHRRPVNTVFQSYALFPHLSVRDNVAFGLRMKKVARVEIARRVDAALVLVHITELAARHPAQLSGGQKQRVALARALVNEPAVLLLDEPLGALDLKLRRQLQVELHHLQQRLGITFLHVTHDQDEALVMSDRIAVMNAGRIQQIGTPEELYERPRNRFVAQFLGSCNLIEAEIAGVNGNTLLARTPLGELQVKRDGSGSRRPGDRVTLAVRPEKIRLARPDEPRGPHSISAQITEVIYGGAETQYRLSSGPLTLSVVALNRLVGHQGFYPRDPVLCQMPEEAVVMLDD